ncbi:hypothetical protein DAPPUDRAFT_249677 [Daphnia pulex]|uniref:Uncharacterized protein n=1 Tax=Daphnia pulex TaxID=6669 RepID=E9GXH0_DAPPU|nr:hypothetical protein DAPPUDRAFT_249677 [Daphnia pulex]|eukprot:EFX75934.1 hypothetical protein DAPPUDRAFT_249677 [Daphnia pulex]
MEEDRKTNNDVIQIEMLDFYRNLPFKMAGSTTQLMVHADVLTTILTLRPGPAHGTSSNNWGLNPTNEKCSMEVDQPVVQDSRKKEPYTPAPQAVDLTPSLLTNVVF